MKLSLLIPVSTAVLLAQQPADPPKPPPGASLEQRTGPSRVSWRVRTLTGNDRLLNWKAAPAHDAFGPVSLLEAAARADALGMDSIEASAAQQVSAEIRKPVDPGLTAAEVGAIRSALKARAVSVVAYRLEALPSDEAARARVLDFARALGAGVVIAADNSAIRVDTGAPGLRIQASSHRNRLPALSAIKDRIFAVHLDARSSHEPLLAELNRLGIRPLVLTLPAATDMARAVDEFEKAAQPVLGDFVVAASKSMPVRGGESLPADVRAKIDAAIPRAAYARPKKPRKLLVLDACVANMSHNTIPHFNLAVELMAKHTGAFEAVFNNDLDNLMWPKIKQWDAIYLNDTVGELFPDPEVRASLLRYVREGGGIGGWHGSPWASRNWRELGDLMSAMDAPHRIEPAYIKLDDPKSPINQAFDGTGLQHTEEYYRFHFEGPTAFYTRDKVRVLLSLDVGKSPAISRPDRNGRPFFSRPDNDYAVAWIKSYGKGRVFYNSMGHMPETMMSKQIMGHVFAAIQFLLGDLEADTTPSAKK